MERLTEYSSASPGTRSPARPVEARRSTAPRRRAVASCPSTLQPQRDGELQRELPQPQQRQAAPAASWLITRRQPAALHKFTLLRWRPRPAQRRAEQADAPFRLRNQDWTKSSAMAAN